MKGFSERNIKSMLAFYRAYPDLIAFVQQAAAQLPAKPGLRPAAKAGVAKKLQQPVAQKSLRQFKPRTYQQ